MRKGPVYRVAPEGVQITGNTVDGDRRNHGRWSCSSPGTSTSTSHLDATVGALVRLYTTRGFRWADVKSGETEAGADGGGLAASARRS